MKISNFVEYVDLSSQLSCIKSMNINMNTLSDVSEAPDMYAIYKSCESTSQCQMTTDIHGILPVEQKLQFIPLGSWWVQGLNIQPQGLQIEFWNGATLPPSEKWVRPIVVAFQLQPFYTSMIHYYGRKRTLSATLRVQWNLRSFCEFRHSKGTPTTTQQSHDWRESTNMIEHNSSWAHGCVTLLGL